MKLGITIRDLLWLTVVVAALMGWWLDHRHLEGQLDSYELRAFRSAIPDVQPMTSKLK